MAGHYTAIMQAFNNVSATSSSINVIVQNPVFGLTVKTNSPISKIQNNSALVIFTLNFDNSNGTILAPSESFKKYSFGTTNCTWTALASHPSSCAFGTLNLPLSLSNESTDTDSWFYPDFGTFNVTLNVSNFVSYMFWNITVDVDTVRKT